METHRPGSAVSYIIGGPATRRPADIKNFMTNDTNKKKFFDLLKKVWCSDAAATRIDRSNRAIVVIDGNAYSLTSENGQVRT